MRHRLRIQRKRTDRDANFNAKTESWLTIGTVWCRKEDVVDRASESVANRVRQNTRRREISIRWRSDITTAMRVQVVGESVFYSIVSMAEVGHQDELRLACEEYRS